MAHLRNRTVVFSEFSVKSTESTTSFVVAPVAVGAAAERLGSPCVVTFSAVDDVQAPVAVVNRGRTAEVTSHLRAVHVRPRPRRGCGGGERRHAATAVPFGGGAFPPEGN